MFLGVLVLKRVAFTKLPETSWGVSITFWMNPLPPKNPFQDAVRQRRPIFWSSGETSFTKHARVELAVGYRTWGKCVNCLHLGSLPQDLSRWWVLYKYFVCSLRTLGKMNPF